MLYYKESALFFGFYSGFTRGEYHIVCVDFIVALRRTKGRRRRTLRSPSPPSSGLHLLTPGNPLRRGMTAAAGLGQFRNPVSGAGRSSPVPNLVWVLCVRAWTVRVSVDFVGHMSFIFHWWWDRLFIPAATWRFAVVYRWITADRAISTISLDASPFHQICRVQKYRKKAFV